MTCYSRLHAICRKFHEQTVLLLFARKSVINIRNKMFEMVFIEDCFTTHDDRFLA